MGWIITFHLFDLIGGYWEHDSQLIIVAFSLVVCLVWDGVFCTLTIVSFGPAIICFDWLCKICGVHYVTYIFLLILWSSNMPIKVYSFCWMNCIKVLNGILEYMEGILAVNTYERRHVSLKEYNCELFDIVFWLYVVLILGDKTYLSLKSVY